MKNNKPSIDGFIPRRPGSQLGDLHEKETEEPIDRSLHTGSNIGDAVGTARKGKVIGRADIDDSLKEIDDIDLDTKENKRADRKARRRKRRENRIERPKSVKRRIIKWVLIGLVVIAGLIGGYVILKAVLAGQNVFQGSILDIIQNQPLKEDENGRSNFLIFGTEAEGHPGADLTDSIMVISVDQDKKDAYMLSLPRDLWVAYAKTCTVGNQGKLNAAYFCASDDGKNEAAGGTALRKKAGEITGLSIQYYIHANWAAMTQAVDAVGGVNVTIESSDPRGILDRNFDWVCNYTCYYVNYKNGQKVHLNGSHALALARARNASGGYGLPGGNFDREKNQQKILKALREKAASIGTLTNLGAVTGLIDALGKNLHTNIETKEIRTIMSLANDIPSDSIIQLTLVDKDKPLVTTGMFNGQSIVQPIRGLLDYTDIQTYVHKNVNSSPVTKEAPHVSVLNGGRPTGVAGTEANKLVAVGFTVDTIANAPKGNYEPVEIYQIDAKKTASLAKLKEMYPNVTVKTTKPPVSVVGETDFVIILGPTQ